MLRGFGCQVDTNRSNISIKGGQNLKACDIEVPADISSAAFFLIAASIAQDSEITLQHVGINSTRTGVIEILKLMGADITLLSKRDIGGEPVADIRVRSALLKGVKIPESLVPLAIDEFPVLFIAAACAKGETILTGAEELRVKESDRIQVMADGLITLGVDGDHRIAMAFSVASLRANETIRIMNCTNVNTSFPGFVDLARQVGIRVTDHG
jgi:3-phosphoshikimate 1-carboxyvinyltransferase